MKRSSTERSTRIRERAQQSWPALPKTAIGADAAAASRSASAKTTFADLPPSSSVTRLIVSAAAAAMPRPTSVEPVKAIFATSGCSTSRLPHTLPGPATTLTTPSGIPASSAIFSNSSARQRRELGRLEHDRVPGRQRRSQLPAGDHEREVPRDDQPHDAERLAEGQRLSAGHRDGVAQQPLGAAGVVADRLRHHLDLAARVADRLAGVARLEHGQVLEALLHRVGQAAQQRRPVGRRDGAPRGERRRRPGDGGVHLLTFQRAGCSPAVARWRAR